MMELGFDFNEARLYGRWSSESSAREYIRLGQTAAARMRQQIPERIWSRLERLASAVADVWAYQQLDVREGSAE